MSCQGALPIPRCTHRGPCCHPRAVWSSQQEDPRWLGPRTQGMGCKMPLAHAGDLHRATFPKGRTQTISLRGGVLTGHLQSRRMCGRGWKDQLPFAKILTGSALLDHPLSKLWRFHKITARKESQEEVAVPGWCEGMAFQVCAGRWGCCLLTPTPEIRSLWGCWSWGMLKSRVTPRTAAGRDQTGLVLFHGGSASLPSLLVTMGLNQERWAKPCSPSSSSCCRQGLSGYWAPGPWGRIKSGLLFPVVPELALQRWEQEKPPFVMEGLWLRGRQTHRDWGFWG